MLVGSACQTSDPVSRQTAKAGLKNISVIMPAYNEAGRVGIALQRCTLALQELSANFEIIVVDDGSTDRTRVEALKRNGSGLVRLLTNGKNRGKGYSLRRGSLHSKGDVVIFWDADAELAPLVLTDFIDALDRFDVVIGSKRHPQSRVITPLSRRLTSFVFNFLVRGLTGLRMGDTQCGFKVFRRPALDEVLANSTLDGYAFDVEVLAIASAQGLRIAELPVQAHLGEAFGIASTFKMFVELMTFVIMSRTARIPVR